MERWLAVIQKWKIWLLIGVVAVCGGLYFLFAAMNKPQSEPEPYELVETKLSSSTKENTPVKIVVDLKGFVVKPGIYTLDTGSRMHELIQMAGGFQKNANEKQINLAEELSDQQLVYVPSFDEEVTALPSGSGSLEKKQEKLNINTATLEELQTLSGIGLKKAQAIIEYREENGSFKTVDGLKEIAGIGEKTVEKLRDSIKI